jgi:hypothetical protein
VGAFFTNYQVRSNSASEVKKALAPLAKSRAYVSPAKNGWVTVYDEESDSQDQELLPRTAAALSKSLQTSVFAFLVHDSDVAVYWLYQNGVLADEFNSAPDYFGEEPSEQTRARVRGDAHKLLPLCVAGTSRADIEAVIHPEDGLPLMAEELFADLGKLLGIDDARICLGFNYFEQEAEEILPDAGDFEPVGSNAVRKKSPSPEKLNEPAAAMLEIFPVAIGMLTQCWSRKHEQELEALGRLQSRMGGKPPKLDKMMEKFRDGMDRGVRDFLKQSQLPDRPTIEELKAARDKGPEALAKLLATRTPTMLADIAAGAVHEGLEAFVAALLAEGLDPHSKDHHGITVLTRAEKLGIDSPIYRMLKTASEKRS